MQLAVFCTVIGLVIGSFLNVIIYRGPAWWGLIDDTDRGTLLGPRSHCPGCGHLIRSWDNIPLFSYVALGGKCRDCGFRIPLHYPLVETLGSVAALLSFLLYGPTTTALAFAVLSWTLIALAMIDLQTGYLPDALTFPLIFLGLAVNSSGMFVPLNHALIGAIAGGGAFWLVSTTYLALRKRDGLGLGDAKLLAALGAWFGWLSLPLIVLIASMSAIAGVLIVGLFRRNLSPEQIVRFGPALAVAGIIAGAITVSPQLYPAL